MGNETFYGDCLKVGQVRKKVRDVTGINEAIFLRPAWEQKFFFLNMNSRTNYKLPLLEGSMFG